jgi:hypothetical protein
MELVCFKSDVGRPENVKLLLSAFHCLLSSGGTINMADERCW